jgi:hypothetical protein
VLGRDTQGVRIIRPGPGDRVVDVAQVIAEPSEAPGAAPANGDGAGVEAGPNGDGPEGQDGSRGAALDPGEEELDLFDEE